MNLSRRDVMLAASAVLGALGGCLSILDADTGEEEPDAEEAAREFRQFLEDDFGVPVVEVQHTSSTIHVVHERAPHTIRPELHALDVANEFVSRSVSDQFDTLTGEVVEDGETAFRYTACDAWWEGTQEGVEEFQDWWSRVNGGDAF